MREMVVWAREMQERRFAETNVVDCNARIPVGMFASHCTMEPAAEALFVRAQKSLLVSARARAHRSRRTYDRRPRRQRAYIGTAPRGSRGVSRERFTAVKSARWTGEVE
jgi:hypothetical protein